MSKDRLYHCCDCLNNISVDKIRELNNRFLCKGCYKDFMKKLPDNDRRKIEYMKTSEYQRDIVSCVICKKKHHRMNYLEGIGDFCNYHHQIVYKVYCDIQNPNKEMWTRIRHWTDRRRLSAYHLNHNDWEEEEQEDYSFQRVIDTIILTPKQEIEKDRLRKVIIESFKFTSNVDIEDTLNILVNNFGGDLENFTFCRECISVVRNAKEGLCGYCSGYDDIDNTENKDEKEYKIIELVNMIKELQEEININRQNIEKYKAPFDIMKNFLNCFNDTKIDENLISL
ncbi:8463_t:CDS:2 [Cetraspora pellucida]|uniref:8463_t:CDS:1 n=1 Tax=Cetraspora pellucida TaxID=1433469 RepID=A0ACA9KRD0_9GLOM|nr:8463_t:CDS:2 [Cetraspora pellucida]